MTARESTNNFFTNFKYKVKSNLRIMIIILILHLVAAPLNLINLMVYMLSKKVGADGFITYTRTFNELYPIIGVITTFLAAAAGIIIAMNIYNYLYKRSVVDMTLSLPLTTNQRFFSDFLAGIFVYLAPFVVSSILSLIINAIGSGLIKEWNSYDGVNLTQGLVTLIVTGFFIMLMIYVLTILVLTCCGSMFEALAYTVLINGLIPGTIAVFGYIFIGNLYGISAQVNILPIIEKTSPIGGLIALINDNMNSIGDMSLKASWLIPYIIITAIYFIASYFLYKRRKAESVSKPFVYKIFYYVMITAITFCIGTLFTMNNRSENIVPLIIITAIIYLIFEVITNRGFKKFYKSAIRYAVTITAVIGISYLFDYTGGFGAVQKIPDASSVKSIEMNYDGVFDKFNNYWLTDYPVYTDKDTIASVIKMHEMVIDRYNKQKSTDNYDTDNYGLYVTNITIMNITIKYNLKNGTSFERKYYLNFDEYIQLMGIDRTDEFIDIYIQNIRSVYNNNKLRMDPENQNVDDYIYVNDIIHQNNPAKLKMTDDILNEFLESYKADLKAMSDEEYYTSSKNTIAKITLGTYMNDNIIYLNENYTNIMMFLNKYKITVPLIDYSKLYSYDLSITFAPPSTDGTAKFNEKTYYQTIGGIADKENSAQNVEIEVSDNTDLQQLLKHLHGDYIATSPCYMININGFTYTVSPEYSDIAKKIYEEYYQDKDQVYEEGMSGYIVDNLGNKYYFDDTEGYKMIFEQMDKAGTYRVDEVYN